MPDWSDPNTIAMYMLQNPNWNKPTPVTPQVNTAVPSGQVFYNGSAQSPTKAWANNIGLAYKSGKIDYNTYLGLSNGSIPVSNYYNVLGQYPISDNNYASSWDSYKGAYLGTQGYDKATMGADEWANTLTDDFEGKYPQPSKDFYSNVINDFGNQPNFYDNGYAVTGMEPGKYTPPPPPAPPTAPVSNNPYSQTRDRTAFPNNTATQSPVNTTMSQLTAMPKASPTPSAAMRTLTSPASARTGGLWGGLSNVMSQARNRFGGGGFRR
jgi:hypothetical protein